MQQLTDFTEELPQKLQPQLSLKPCLLPPASFRALLLNSKTKSFHLGFFRKGEIGFSRDNPWLWNGNVGEVGEDDATP